MHSAYLVTGLAAFASTVTAAPTPSLDPYIGDLRTFSATGCSLDNQGVGTFTESMTGTCNLYAVQFSSLYIHLTPGWVFRAHNDPTCQDNGTVIAETLAGSGYPIVCNNHTNAWVAYSVDRVVPGQAAL
ncbi:hypothetical protein F5Y04DRAFT_164197 [Hypomontagnella monticulosa]|nr:hypothetical protein F5Y04DRAFT_164197 [Hypomontagnella monticulosa]